jgi:hypothetical protein
VQEKTKIPGKGKGKVVSNNRGGVAAQQFQVRVGKSSTVPVTLGFTKSNELFVGRLAMLGFAAACIGEVVSGQGCALVGFVVLPCSASGCTMRAKSSCHW